MILASLRNSWRMLTTGEEFLKSPTTRESLVVGFRLDQVTSYMSDNESGAESVSSRGFRGQANYYTGADDKVACCPFLQITLSLLSGDSSIHCGQRSLRRHWRRRTVAADGGEAGGGEALLAVHEGEVQEKHPQEARLLRLE